MNNDKKKEKPSETAMDVTNTMFALNATLAADISTQPEVIPSTVDTPVSDGSIGGDY